MKLTKEYRDWIVSLKSKIRSAQLKAAVAVNGSLIRFYWELGNMISEKILSGQWGDKILDRISKDLREEFQDMKGLSTRNLKYCRQFYEFYTSGIGQQPVAQTSCDREDSPQIRSNVLDVLARIPWGHNILIFSKSKSLTEADFYLYQTLENQWSRDTLALQIKSGLFLRQGKAVSNFKYTLSENQSELAQQTIKDPYVFDFLTMENSFREKDIEKQLVGNVTKFLLELGKGFAFIGQQYQITVGETDYYIDLLFYHVKLRCYVVIELKNTKFIPEYAGKLNFYLSAVDSHVKSEEDNQTIGILLCRDKNNIETEFALRDINKPMGVSEFQLTEIIPEELKSSLPTIEEIENELGK